MSKLNLQNILSEMTNDEFRDAEEADRLESHPERDMIKKIQALIRNEKNKSIDPNSAAVDKDGNKISNDVTSKINKRSAERFAKQVEIKEQSKFVSLNDQVGKENFQLDDYGEDILRRL